MADIETEDELRPEYELTSLRVCRVGAARTHFKGVLVSLEPDVAAVFADAASVNEALRFVIKMAKENPLSLQSPTNS